MGVLVPGLLQKWAGSPHSQELAATSQLTWHVGLSIMRLLVLGIGWLHLWWQRRSRHMQHTSPSLSSAPPVLPCRRARTRFVGRPQLLNRV